MAKIIDGKQVAADLRAEIAERTKALAAKGKIPGLGVILVGDDPASHSYVRGKEKACEKAGIKSKDFRLSEDTSEEILIEHVESLNKDPEIHGILVQLPLPKHINEQNVLLAIDPKKDVDGFHPVSIGKMVLGQETFFPCTPHGILKLLEISGIEVPGKHAVILGRSNIVGKPVANLLLQKGAHTNATVTVCHTGTKDIPSFTRNADILIVAAGRPGMVTGDMVKEGAVVIDVGVNRIPDNSKKKGYRLTGDVDFESVEKKAGFITPVPGGVGPMTITMLLYNTLISCEQSKPKGAE